MTSPLVLSDKPHLEIVPTCVLQHKSIAAEGRVTPECQEERVGTALNAIWNVRAIETTQQRAEGVWSIVDMQKIITGLQAKPGNRKFHKLILDKLY